jgi:hypothetical protein
MRKGMMGVVVFGLVAGCSTYEPAKVENGMISNPAIGWDGFSISIPEGVTLLDPVQDPTGRAAELHSWYDKQSDRQDWKWYANYSEQFLMEDAEGEYIIRFISETFNIPTTWSMMTSVDLQYFLQHLMNRKMVVNNDVKALHETVDIKGRRGWYVSGLCRPYFNRKITPQAYEGYFILGRYKEVFWVEGFGDQDSREQLKRKVREMVESLTVY